MLEDYIVSFIEGRIRIRHEALKDDIFGAATCQILLTVPGILHAEHKSRTGSLLIHYHAKTISGKKICALLAPALQGDEYKEKGHMPKRRLNTSHPQVCCSLSPCAPCAPCKLTPAQRRKIVHKSMVSSFFLTLLHGKKNNNKKAHYMAGGAFAALSLAHLWRLRNVV